MQAFLVQSARERLAVGVVAKFSGPRQHLQRVDVQVLRQLSPQEPPS